jgi:hypothetical protein
MSSSHGSPLLNALKRGKGWRRIGAVSSVVWLLFASALVVVDRVDNTTVFITDRTVRGMVDHGRVTFTFWHRTLLIDRAILLQEKLNKDILEAGFQQWEASAEYVDAISNAEEKWTLRIGPGLLITLGPIAAVWLLAYVLFYAGRWVIRGFTDSG